MIPLVHGYFIYDLPLTFFQIATFPISPGALSLISESDLSPVVIECFRNKFLDPYFTNTFKGGHPDFRQIRPIDF